MLPYIIMDLPILGGQNRLSSTGMCVNKCIKEGIGRPSNKIINSSLVNNSNNVAINNDNKGTDLNDGVSNPRLRPSRRRPYDPHDFDPATLYPRPYHLEIVQMFFFAIHKTFQ